MKNCAIRAKGNTSLSNVKQYGNDRYSFKIEFDHYDNTLTYHGLDKLVLNNNIQDNTLMKDYLTHRMMAYMGVDAPLACLSKKTRSFFDYFYQLFAQVTNPPIDALREHMVTSTTLYLGNHGNLLEDSRTACQLVRLERPLLSEEEFEPAVSVPSTAAMPARARCRLRSSSLPKTSRLRFAMA